MTEDEKLAMLKDIVGDSISEDIFPTYLTLAGRKIIAKAYPYDDTVTEVPDKYDFLQVEIAAYMINKRGAEGQTAHTENGITRQYENADVPESMLKAITPHVGVFSQKESAT